MEGDIKVPDINIPKIDKDININTQKIEGDINIPKVSIPTLDVDSHKIKDQDIKIPNINIEAPKPLKDLPELEEKKGVNIIKMIFKIEQKDVNKPVKILYNMIYKNY